MAEIKCSTSGYSDSNADFWNQCYVDHETGWDLGYASPPLVAYFEKFTCKNKSILIPGCGNAYEAEWLLQNGFKNITLIDIAPALVETLMKKLEKHIGKELTLIAGDFFKHSGQYDFIIEQTFFCAINPTMRTAYVQHMHRLLKPGGKLAGLLFDKQFENNPPFGGSRAEYLELFKPLFNIDQMENCTTSAMPRLGSELFFELSPKSNES